MWPSARLQEKAELNIPFSSRLESIGYVAKTDSPAGDPGSSWLVATTGSVGSASRPCAYPLSYPGGEFSRVIRQGATATLFELWRPSRHPRLPINSNAREPISAHQKFF